MQIAPVASRPKHTTIPPVRDNEPRYSVTFYGRTRPTEHPKVTLIDETSDPHTYKEATAQSNAAKWDTACEDEIRNFRQMGVYDVVPRPDDHKVIGCK